MLETGGAGGLDREEFPTDENNPVPKLLSSAVNCARRDSGSPSPRRDELVVEAGGEKREEEKAVGGGGEKREEEEGGGGEEAMGRLD